MNTQLLNFKNVGAQESHSITSIQGNIMKTRLFRPVDLVEFVIMCGIAYFTGVESVLLFLLLLNCFFRQGEILDKLK